MIGVASDRTRSRWDRRRPYLLAGAVVSALSVLMIFSPPALGEDGLHASRQGDIAAQTLFVATHNELPTLLAATQAMCALCRDGRVAQVGADMGGKAPAIIGFVAEPQS